MASFQPVRLAYNTYEPVSGVDESLAPVIYLHGLTLFKETWGDIPQVIANATKRRSYSVDARNHGDSEWTDQFNLDMNSDDLIHFMDTLGIKKASIVGHSMGGTTAIKTALKRPERIEKIIVEDMIVRKVSPEVIKTVLTYATLARKGLEEAPAELDKEGVKYFLVNYIATNSPPELKRLATERKYRDPEKDTRFMALKRDANGRYTFKCNLDSIAKALKNLETLTSDPQGQFQGPACFIYGKLSPFLVGADEHHIKQFFPNAVLKGLEDVGHEVHSSKPLEFTDAVLRFISW